MLSLLGEVIDPNTVQTGAGVAVALGLVRLIETLVGKLTARVSYAHGDRTKLEDLHDWHAPNANGVQSWRNAEEARVELRRIARLVERQLAVLEDIKARKP